MYSVSWNISALDNLYKLTNKTAIKLKAKVELYLAQSPKELGKLLTGKYKDLYRYRYGDYRIIYEIDKTNKRVIILKIGHRRGVYE